MRIILLWGVLVVLTGLTWGVGYIGAGGTVWALALLFSVFFKGHWIIQDFMGLRHAPVLWQNLLHGWLLLVCGVILLAFVSHQ